MKKTYIKYLGVASTTLLAVAPVVAPVAQNALNANLTHQVFATDNTGTVLPTDLSGSNEYSRLLQQATVGASDPFTTITGSGNPGSWSADTLKGLIMLAQVTNGGLSNFPLDAFVSGASGSTTSAMVNPSSSDVALYLYTNLDGSTRNNLNDFYYSDSLYNNTAIKSLRLNTGSTNSDVQNIISASRFLSDKLGDKNPSNILGAAAFGDPNKATLSIKINGKSNPDPIATLLKQGRIVITLTATSSVKDANGRYKTAQAFLNLNNSDVLLNGSDTSGSTLSSLLNVSNMGSLDNGSGLISGEPQKISDTTGYSYYMDPNGGNRKPFTTNLSAYSDLTAQDAASAAVADLDSGVKSGSGIGAYAQDTLIVPEGTSLQSILNSLQKVRFNGAPSVSSYSKPVADSGALAFDNVVANDNTANAWLSEMASGNSYLPFSSITDGTSTTSISQSNFSNYVNTQGASSVIARPGQITIPVQVKGDVFVPTAADASNSKYTFRTSEANQSYVSGYTNPKLTATVNVIVYPNPSFWGNEYVLKSKPSFALFSSTGSNAVVPAFYDDGATVKENSIPTPLQSSTLKLTVGDSRFYDATSKTTSKNKLDSFFKAAFGQSVVNRQILISDEAIKDSVQTIDTNNLPGDNDFPGADQYTLRPGDVTKYAGDGGGFNNYGGYTVDTSAVDLSKAGTYLVKYTYTNSKNEQGVPTQTSTISIPVTVGNSEAPVFYFTKSTDQTITQGDNFNQYMFKVAENNDALNAMIANGQVYDGAPYVDNPSGTGITVTVTGTVDTNVPGKYQLTYTATNLRNGTSTTLTRNINVVAKGSDTNNTNSGSGTNTPSTDSNITDFQATGYVNYVPGYGINVYDGPNGTFTGQRLSHGTAWLISHKAVVNGKTWYQVGGSQWVDGSYIQFNPVNTMKSISGVATVSYVPGYSIRVWGSADSAHPTDKMLPDGSSWQVFGELNGYYNVGGDQWIQKDYATLTD